jgi:hypothetical protein
LLGQPAVDDASLVGQFRGRAAFDCCSEEDTFIEERAQLGDGVTERAGQP